MKINRTVATLIISDFLVNAGFSLFAPVFAIFVTGQIRGGSIEVVGFAAAIGQIVKSVLQIPVAKFLDKNHGEFDDFYSLRLGNTFLAIVPFLYLFARSVVHLYLIQAVFGLGLALAVPPWYAIFTRHIDKSQENVEWSLDSVGIGISGASAAAAGGIMAHTLGFSAVFIFAGVLAIVGGIVQMRIFKDLKAKVPPGAVKPLPDRAS